ncbi:MAG: hypothetical protein LC742_01455 [Acidobacteria bacterium]|nr:hypothetical protein [Acidobacteriota bacterium]
MSAKLTVIFYIILCLEAGVVLTFLPWVHPFGLGDWADNFFLVYAVQKTGLQGLQHAVASGWVRGAVTGLGLLNLAMAFWEMAHFRQAVNSLHGHARHSEAQPHADRTPPASQLSDHERRDDARNESAV